MKKTFQLTQEDKKPERVIEAIKHEIRKYMKRERGKKLPDGADCWELECRFGRDSDETKSVTSREIITALDDAFIREWSHCYIEIIAKATQRREPSMQMTEDKAVKEVIEE